MTTRRLTENQRRQLACFKPGTLNAWQRNNMTTRQIVALARRGLIALDTERGRWCLTRDGLRELKKNAPGGC